MALDPQGRDRLRHLFAQVGTDPANTSPIYARIGEAVTDSYPTLELFDTVEERKRRPVTLFAAVHYLILKGAEHPLADMYEAPELKSSLEGAGRAFIDFCDEFSTEIVRVMNQRAVQTNEVNRAVGFLPALMEVSRKSGRRLALVELGAGAGLNLLFDRFHYDYGGGPNVGSPGSQVRLSTQLRSHVPKIDSNLPILDYRVGLDTEPVDINNENEVLWLRACLWVGEVAREQRFGAALALAKREWPDVREADAITDLGGILNDVDTDLELCIYNSWMMSWLEPEQRDELAQRIKRISKRRDVWWITFEGQGQVPGLEDEGDIASDASVLGLQHLGFGDHESRVLAHMQHHGTWLDWRDEATTAW